MTYEYGIAVLEESYFIQEHCNKAFKFTHGGKILGELIDLYKIDLWKQDWIFDNYAVAHRGSEHV